MNLEQWSKNSESNTDSCPRATLNLGTVQETSTYILLVALWFGRGWNGMCHWMLQFPGGWKSSPAWEHPGRVAGAQRGEAMEWTLWGHSAPPAGMANWKRELISPNLPMFNPKKISLLSAWAIGFCAGDCCGTRVVFGCSCWFPPVHRSWKIECTSSVFRHGKPW